MSQTPYASPKARLSDPLELKQPKPTSLRRAITCLWISVALTVVLAGAHLIGALATPDVVQATVTAAIAAGLLALVAVKVNGGRGWARWLYVGVYAFGSLTFMAFIVLAPQAFLSMPMPDQVSAAVQFILQTVALFLMFTHASRQWFKAPHAEPSSSAP
jgi:hypothetical protein